MRTRSLIGVGFTIGGILVACSSSTTTDTSGGSDGGFEAGSDTDAGITTGDSSTPTPGKDSGTQTQKDSGGAGVPDAATCTPTCPVGAGCTQDTDCASGACGADGKCATSAADDGKKDDGESDIDCGGATTDNAPKCAIGKTCVTDADCANNACGVTGTCATSAATDGVKDDGESDIDCGGNTTDGAPKCANGKTCVQDDDCTSGACSAGGTCAASAAVDGKKDDGESDVDCGGNTTDAAPLCATGKACVNISDCVTGDVCDLTNTCNPPTSTDGIQDGTETDIDCGGGAPTNAPACVAGKNCKVGADCSVGGCNYLDKCATAISCTAQHGGNTCGPTGTDNCCVTLPAAGLPQSKINNVAVTTTTIDKYNITAGRMRAFVTATNGDMRTYIANNTPTWWNASWSQFLPSQLDSGQYGSPVIGDGVYQEFGPYEHGKSQGANEGCYVKGNGARSYRLPDTINADFGDEQDYTQDFDDERPMNCVESYILWAFCAWDGGHPASIEQINYVWGTAKYPWGAQTGTTPTNCTTTAGGSTAATCPQPGAPVGYNVAYGADPQNGVVGGPLGFGYLSYAAFQGSPFVAYNAPPVTSELKDLQYANYNYNWFDANKNQVNTDYTIYIAQPGRFPNGNGPYGHSDLAGNVFDAVSVETTANASTTTDGVATDTPYSTLNNCWSRSGSWQGHGIPYSASGCGVDVSATNKYWAMGGRCAR